MGIRSLLFRSRLPSFLFLGRSLPVLYGARGFEKKIAIDRWRRRRRRRVGARWRGSFEKNVLSDVVGLGGEVGREGRFVRAPGSTMENRAPRQECLFVYVQRALQVSTLSQSFREDAA